ncbi:MAG TPA: HAMP domain-containing sensor histidine kinase [Conexibacter sp.]|jgi:signal transduction histidine kinase|nr:HAMP domain-containing sensor histidine kinase [Conexibacter sp.]
MSRLDLRDRVTLATALVLSLGLAVLTLGGHLLLAHQLKNDVSARLRERADAQLALVSVVNGRVVVHDAAGDGALDEQSWVFVDGGIVRRPVASPRVQRAADALAHVAGPTERSLGEQVRLRAEPAYAPDSRRRIGTVVVGASLVPYEHTERIALLANLLLDAFVLAAGALLARRAVGKALQPVAQMTRRAADWSEHDVDRRFDLGPPRDELTALSATLDGLLARIAASLRHEQRFSAEMAHELRTPLSGVRGEAELMLREPGLSDDARAGLGRILRGTERMQSVIETLLTVARRDGEPGRGASDARAGAARAVEAQQTSAQRAGITLAYLPSASALRVSADEDSVAQALGPLLENAVRHASTRVTVALERENGHVDISVQDDGPGFGDADPDALFEPGTSSVGGAGLGLPLARRVARACGGEVSAEATGAGGRFVLRLPGFS